MHCYECECDWSIEAASNSKRRAKNATRNKNRTEKCISNRVNLMTSKIKAQNMHATNEIKCVQCQGQQPPVAASQRPRTKDGSVCLSFPNRFNITYNFSGLFLCTLLAIVVWRARAGKAIRTSNEMEKLYYHYVHQMHVPKAQFTRDGDTDKRKKRTKRGEEEKNRASIELQE